MVVPMRTVSIDRVIKVAGSQRLLAEACGVSPAAVFHWRVKGHIPPSQALNVSSATGIAVSALPIRWATQPSGPSEGRMVEMDVSLPSRVERSEDAVERLPDNDPLGSEVDCQAEIDKLRYGEAQ
jgi:DNA-binding transcriptional regulator YdaS (Cro superfamily)